MSKKDKKSWVVKLECVVTKELICEDCTRSEAEANPFDYAIDEREISQSDYTVQSIQLND